MKLDLRKKILIPNIILIVIGIIFSAAVSYLISKSVVEEAALKEHALIVDSVTRYVDSWIHDRKTEIIMFSRQKIYEVAVQINMSKKIDPMLKDLKETYGFYEYIGVANEKGEVIYASDSNVAGKANISGKSHFVSSMEGKSSVSDIEKDQLTGKFIFAISAPILKQEKIVGVFFGVIDLMYFNSRFIDPVEASNTGYVYMLDKEGNVLAHPKKENIMALNVSQYDFVGEILSGKNGRVFFKSEGEKKIASFHGFRDLSWILVTEANLEDLLSGARKVAYFSAVANFSTVVAAVIIIILVTNSIVKPIHNVAEGLKESANQLTDASAHVSSASWQVAERTSLQATFTEEAYSALEQTFLMTLENTNNTYKADGLMKEAGVTVEQTTESMEKMTRYMGEVFVASEEIQKIIKTIDEIAFQTHLLALNAAVEAARAGKAGAGFGVVADEVRYLAKRVAEAAKDTEELIKNTLQRINEGSTLVEKSNKDFNGVATIVTTMGALIEEIAIASDNQAKGIEKVNKILTEMESVTQKNAANAEETATASEEMSAQSEHLREFVRELMGLIGGDNIAPSTSAKEANPSPYENVPELLEQIDDSAEK